MKDLLGGIRNPFSRAGNAPRAPELPPRPQSETVRSAFHAFTNSGLFLKDWYLSTYRDVAEANQDPLRHFLEAGWKEGRKPNPLFDPLWYLARNPDASASGMNPLFHYWMLGEKHNRQPAPLFETEWYRERYAAEIGAGSPLAHYLTNRSLKRFSPNRYFDVGYYLSNNPDVDAAGVDPLEHFATTGFREGRSPSPNFDLMFYVRKYLRGDPRDPLTHYFEVGRAAGFSTFRPIDARTSASEIRRYAGRGPEFEEFNPDIASGLAQRSKVIAFYLPQFHTFPENDQWWGSGFTEWTNIARGTPRFVGHHQPRIPRDLGFYDLSDPGVMRRQIDIARATGLHGFCFYYYNFNGKRLLEKPVDAFLSAKDMQMPFCLMWANENWTRRWDGAEAEVLIRQDYKAEDAGHLIDDIARHFADSRYIRIDGRPLLLLYRADIVPNTKRTLGEWRRLFETRHNEKPLIFMAQAFDNLDPRTSGFDGAFEFPPHKVTRRMSSITSACEPLDDSFSAQVYRYDDVVNESIVEATPEFSLIKTVFPSWDNDARRQGHGLVVTDSSPSKYGKWLESAIEFSQRNPVYGENLVFINAWNEWAEGAYLEPDVYFGSAYLNATARAIVGRRSTDERFKILLVGHDAFPAGAQLLVLNLAQRMKAGFGVDVEVLLCGDGELTALYKDVVATHVATTDAALKAKIAELAARGFKHAVVNTVAAGKAVTHLKDSGFKVLSLVHELPKIIGEKRLEVQATNVAKRADSVVFPAVRVRDAFRTQITEPACKVHVRPQGLYQQVTRIANAKAVIRREFALPDDAKIVVNVGYGDLRKGIDLFCSASQLVAAKRLDVFFVWIGRLDETCSSWLRDAAAFPNVLFAGQRNDVDLFLSAADVFALTSREDPYPSVGLEALAVGTPIIAFADAGGFSDLLESEKLGLLVPHSNVVAMSEAILDTLNRPAEVAWRDAMRATEYVERNCSFDDYAFDLLQFANAAMKRISVIVPNFNYAKYLQERLISIFDQSYPVFEIIVLDDASTDGSMQIIESVSKSTQRTVRTIRNAKNTGSPYAQWKRGLSVAKGDLVWIAEADDLSAPSFLSALAAEMADPDVLFAFSGSQAIDSDGLSSSVSYKSYYSKVFPGALTSDFTVDAAEFARRFLSQRNLLLNVSAILWRKDVLEKAFEDIASALPDFSLAADWLLYLAACTQSGRVAFRTTELNSHRRHERGVTSQTTGQKQLDEALRVHSYFVEKFGTNDRIRDLQLTYEMELREQFDLASNENAAAGGATA